MSALDRMTTFSSDIIKGSTRMQGNIGDLKSKYDTSSPSGAMLSKLASLGFNMDELEQVLDCFDDQLIISGAGSGKSTALIFKIIYDMVSGRTMVSKKLPTGAVVNVPDKIWVSTFLKSGAEELSKKLAQWQYKFGYTISADSIEFSTMHAEFKRALTALGVKTVMCPIDYRDPKSASALLRKAINSLQILPSDRDKLSEDDYQNIEGMVANYRNRLDNTRYTESAFKDYGITPAVMDCLVRTFEQNRRLEGVMDFEDLQELLYKFLYITPNKAVQDFIASRYSFIYLDEFQDTSQIQYAILKFYARDRLIYNRDSITKYDKEKGGEIFDGLYKPFEGSRGKIVAVGDDDQCIYGWRGSDIKIILNWFEVEFKPTVLNLTVNYRCPSNILNPVIPSITRNELRHSKPLRSSKEGGKCIMYLSNNQFSMLNHMYEEIEKDMRDGLSVAILCRTNYDGVLPALLLEMKHKYNFSISGANMGISTALPRKLLAVSSLFTERSSLAVKNTLSLFVPRQNQWKVAQMIKSMKNDNSSIWSVDMADVNYSCSDLYTLISTLRKLCLGERGERVQKKELYALKYLYSLLYEKYFPGDSIYCISARTYLSMLIYILDEMSFDSVFSFQETMEMFNDSLVARVKRENTPISIVTIHEFKGKERDSIYIWHDTEGVFPSQKVDVDNQSQLEEERRVHYIACTRAKKKLTIYATASLMGRFAKELNCEKVTLVNKVSGVLNEETRAGKDSLSDDIPPLVI